MNCDEVAKYVDVYVDNEFDNRDRHEFESHVTACQPCRQLVQTEREFRAHLKTALKPVAAPEQLREAIVSQLNDGARTTVAPESGSGSILRFMTGFVPLAAAAGLAIFFMWPSISGTADDDAPPLGSALVTNARPTAKPAAERRPAPPPAGQPTVIPASYSLMKADVRGGEPEIRRYMKGRVPFAIEAPLKATGAVRLAGAREITSDGRPAVLFIYDVSGERVNIVQTAARVQDSAAPSLQLQRRGTTTWGQFTRGGIHHTIVSEMEPIRISRLLETHLRK